jgi:hypothetical protein
MKYLLLLILNTFALALKRKIKISNKVRALNFMKGFVGLKEANLDCLYNSQIWKNSIKVKDIYQSVNELS